MKEFSSMPALVKSSVMSEKELTERINEGIQTVMRLDRKGLEKAKEIGEWLLEVKKVCKHGEWKLWVEKNVIGLSYESVKLYLRLPRYWEFLESHPEITTLKGALDFISQKMQEEKQEKEREDQEKASLFTTSTLSAPSTKSVTVPSVQATAKEESPPLEKRIVETLGRFKQSLINLKPANESWKVSGPVPKALKQVVEELTELLNTWTEFQKDDGVAMGDRR